MGGGGGGREIQLRVGNVVILSIQGIRSRTHGYTDPSKVRLSQIHVALPQLSPHYPESGIR